MSKSAPFGNKTVSDCFYGSVTVGERGQIVIPAEARQALNINPGDKLVVMHHPIYDGLMISTIDELQNFLNEMSRELDHMKKHVEDAE